MDRAEMGRNDTSLNDTAEALARQIGDFVEASAAGRAAPGAFDELVEPAFALQYERVEPFRRLCESRSVGPDDVRGPGAWERVPPVPVAAFRSLELAVAPAREVFRSSGTTGGPGSRSVHHHPFPDLYRRVIDATFARACLPPGSPRQRPLLSLVPSRREVPDSSLGFLCDHVLATHGAAGSGVAFSTEGGVDVEEAREFFLRCVADDAPFTLLATAFALAELLDALEPVAAPAGSTVFETGGFKGRRRTLERADLLRRVEAGLGIAADRVVREYGMAELTGHVYTRILHGGAPDVFVPPPWMRVRLLDPESLRPVPAGEPGLVAIFDLANVGSALHVLSQDLGAQRGDGFVLLGRAPGSALRGCSLVVEEAMVD